MSLRSSKATEAPAPAVPEAEKDFYHGQVMEKDDNDLAGEEGADQLKDWHQGKLKFKKHIDDRYRLGMSAPDASMMEEGFTVFDPRGTFSSK